MDNKTLLITLLSSVLLSTITAFVVATQLAQSSSANNYLEIRQTLTSLKTQLTQQQLVNKDLAQQLAGREQATGQPNRALLTAANTQAIESRLDANSEEPSSDELDQAVDLEQRNLARNQNRSTSRKQTLIERGFNDDEATWVLQTETEVRLDSLNEQYRARRAQAQQEQANGTRAKSGTEQLKEKLGNDYYERYLKANGLPTSVSIGSVLKSSPGANAGLLAGDKIVSYDGKRTFNIDDLNNLTIDGQVGQSVLIEILRNGNPRQLILPRGPIGIVSQR